MTGPWCLWNGALGMTGMAPVVEVEVEGLTEGGNKSELKGGRDMEVGGWGGGAVTTEEVIGMGASVVGVGTGVVVEAADMGAVSGADSVLELSSVSTLSLSNDELCIKKNKKVCIWQILYFLYYIFRLRESAEKGSKKKSETTEKN